MKTIYKTLLLLLVLTQFSCNDDERNDNFENQINGQWRLTKVAGGLVGINHTFDPITIVWTFNTSNNTVTIVNNNPDDSIIYDGFETGVYEYQIENNPVSNLCDDVITIDGIEMGCIDIVNNKLVIDQSFSDGFQLEFIE
ncbi:hypothetical protein [Flavobacterium dankookense]|uniref:Lipocalin-like protein n=1 Tax=Flavobacterium dankookense TaxID=706186 RepID=A0A4R6Q995_9FLAO|nr:hypothetical protein [Flavobacterium dankookense]TDP59158.1 hypothetical protein BC748_1400 [Flavobacterium dankookense]